MQTKPVLFQGQLYLPGGGGDDFYSEADPIVVTRLHWGGYLVQTT